ncbi:MAG: extensin family protein [Roseobacter sp.]
MRVLAAILIVAAAMASASPETSKRPVGRAGSTADGTVSIEPSAVADVVRAQNSASDRVTSLRPKTRPRAFRRIVRQQERLRKKGAVCGNPDIKGQSIGRVTSGVRGCGIPDAVRITSVSGIGLSPAAVMNCDTARTLDSWVTISAIPRLKDTGGGLTSLRVIGHYACRPRNNRPGARISEHGKGRAIDIAGFRLRDGSMLSVFNDWKSDRGFLPMREMHRDACGIFGTVLGPKADRFHLDHFHFDTARHRGGPYCR